MIKQCVSWSTGSIKSGAVSIDSSVKSNQSTNLSNRSNPCTQMDGRVVDDAIYGIKLELESAGMKAEHSFISGTCAESADVMIQTTPTLNSITL